MDITPISKEAFAVMAECEETKKPFGITIDPKGSDLHFVWAFKIDRSKAHFSLGDRYLSYSSLIPKHLSLRLQLGAVH